MTRVIPAAQAPAVSRHGALSPLGLVQLFASVILLASAWPLTKLAIAAGATPLWFAEGRAVLSGIIASILLLAFGGFRRPTRPDLPALFAIGTLQLGLYFALAHEAAAWVQAGRVAILANTTTIWVVPLSLIFLREAMPVRRWIAAGIGIAGVVVLIDPPAVDYANLNTLIGQLLLLGAALSWSVAIIVTRAARPNLSMFALLPWCFLIASLVLAPLVLWHAPDGTFGHQPICWIALGYIGLVAGPLGTWCVMEATAKLPALVSSLGFLTTPAVSLLIATVFLHEPLTPDLLAGSALIMSGVAIAAWPRRAV
ncbi:MAG TPA: DMT family transporter [Rhodopila sp.]|uniref:DMT family transporter n=1 Tax=Rhodopila sp. TaxID=2480087 RepID=UPI002C20833F|nr:DMT family transporter [Rhodopila sp.]HVY16627.1 DMT family transporter [Rhodopila sp.]